LIEERNRNIRSPREGKGGWNFSILAIASLLKDVETLCGARSGRKRESQESKCGKLLSNSFHRKA